MSVCVSVCLSTAACLHYCTDPDVTWRSSRGCPLVVHYWADLQSGDGWRCCGNIMRTRTVSMYMLVLALCLVTMCKHIVGLTPISSSQLYHDLYHKTPYLRERVNQLAPLMDELDPYEPVNFVVYTVYMCWISASLQLCDPLSIYTASCSQVCVHQTPVVLPCVGLRVARIGLICFQGGCHTRRRQNLAVAIYVHFL